jgi:excisionase family DNA binding protein
LQVLHEGTHVTGVEDKLLMDIRELSARTGLSVGTIYHWVSQKRIPVVRFSARCIRFRRGDIEAWIAARVVEAAVDGYSFVKRHERGVRTLRSSRSAPVTDWRDWIHGGRALGTGLD